MRLATLRAMAGETSREREQLSASELAARLEGSRNELMDAIAALDEEGLRAHPDASQWSAAEVLAHLLSTERFLTQRAQDATVRQDCSISPRTERERTSDARSAAQRMPVPQLIHGLLAVRRDTLRQIDALTRDQLARPVHHSSHGEVTVAWLFDYVAAHEREHAAQIRAMREASAASRS